MSIEYKTLTSVKQEHQIYAKMPTISNNVIKVYTIYVLGPVQVGPWGNLLCGDSLFGSADLHCCVVWNMVHGAGISCVILFMD